MLPAHGQTRARIEGGAAAITLVVPPNVAARIMVDDGPNALQIDEARFPRHGREYRSPNFDAATDRVTLRLDVGASRWSYNEPRRAAAGQPVPWRRVGVS